VAPPRTRHSGPNNPRPLSSIRALADQAFSRAAGAPLIAGNSVRPLKDARENYPAWLDAIAAARNFIHFESYIIHDDEMGLRFAAALAEKAREGVRVRLIYDWLGALGKTSGRFWRSLRDAGVEVRCFNPPRIESPLGWLSRDHRKMVAVDGKVCFVTGLCVGRMWAGDSERGIDPWRDTGIEVKGPAVADLEQAFGQVWAAIGGALPNDELPPRESFEQAGNTMVRVIATVPNTAGLYRLDQLIAALARKRLWLTDAYFVGVSSYVQGLCAAALDGVDVRLLVPGATDIPVLRALSRAGYKPLLEAGVRVYEWNGAMVHAKTAVADGRWARVGSSNLNISSWMGNYELDVAVEDREFARDMEETYQDDLENATEIVLTSRKRVRPLSARRRGGRRRFMMRNTGSVGRVGAGAVTIGSAVGAAITDHRTLGPAEAKVMAGSGLLVLVLGLVALFLPRAFTIPLALFGGWMGISLLVRAYKLYREGKRLASDRTEGENIPPGSEVRSGRTKKKL
jgi:cardiolipin synthase